jgi:hypothetical protein
MDGRGRALDKEALNILDYPKHFGKPVRHDT